MGLWGLLAVFSFVLSGELGFLLGMAYEALRVGAVMLFAPIGFSFEIGNELGIAPGAYFFGNAVLVTPPAIVTVTGLDNVSVGRAGSMAATDNSTGGDGKQHDETFERH